MLCASDCESFTVKEILDLDPVAREEFATLRLGYTESPGGAALRAQIAALYTGMPVSQVLTFAGAEEAIFAFMNVALSKGDHIIVHAPHYQSLSEIARGIGCEVTLWETRDENGWELELDALVAALKPNTRAIVINSPHNPTGYLMSAEKLRRIVEIARDAESLAFFR